MSRSTLFVWLSCDVDAASELISRLDELGYDTDGMTVSEDIDADALFECSGDSLEDETMAILRSARAELVISDWSAKDPLHLAMIRALLDRPEPQLVSCARSQSVTYATPREFLDELTHSAQ